MILKRLIFVSVALGILAMACGLRLTNLANRPVHTDEAVHAKKLGDLIERGDYVYDPHEFHGPTLNYGSAAVAHYRGHRTHAELDEYDLRLPAALVGIALVAGLLLMRNSLGNGETLAAMLAVATCHELVFFSRDSIQEIFLVCFGFFAAVSIARALASPTRSSRWLWAVYAGMFVGLIHATKETWVLSLPAAAVALGVVAWHFRQTIRPIRWRRLWLAPAALLVATGVAFVLLSNFGKNPAALGDSISTYWNYLSRAAGDASAMGADRHSYPFGRYITWLFNSPTHGWIYTQAPLLALAMLGFVSGWNRRVGLSDNQHRWRVGLGIYAFVLFGLYSLIPYKTPWCILSVILPLCLLAGCGAMDLLRLTRPHGLHSRFAAGVLLLVLSIFQYTSAHRASFVDIDNEANPSVYAHTTKDIPALAEILERWRAADPELAKTTNIKLFVENLECLWPLPWYLRNFHHLDDPNHPNPTARPELIFLVAHHENIASLQMQMTDYLYSDTFSAGGKPLLVPPILPALRERIWLRHGIELRIYGTMELNERMYEALAPKATP